VKLIKALVFIIFISTAFLWVALTNEKSISLIANYFLEEQGIEISELSHFHLNVDDLSIGRLKVINDNINVTLTDVRVNFRFQGLEPILESIVIAKLELQFDGGEAKMDKGKASRKQNDLDLRSLFPRNFYPLLSDINLSIEESRIIAPDYLQHEIEFSSLNLSSIDDKLTLEIATLEIEGQPDIAIQIVISVSGETALFIKINNKHNKNGEDSLTLHLHPDINAQGNIALTLNAEIKLNQIVNFLQQSLKDSAGIHAINGTIAIRSQHTLQPIYSEAMELQDMFISSAIHSETNLHVLLKDQALESVSLKLLANLHHQNTGKEKKSSLHIDKQSELKAQPNTKNTLFKEDPSLAFLSNKALLLKPKNEFVLSYQNKNISSQGELTATWADSGQRAYFDYSLHHLSGKIENTNDVEINIKHKAKARWNRFFASNHQADSKLIYRNDSLTFSSFINEEHLKSALDVKGTFKQERLKISYFIETLKFSENPNGLNETLAYWDEDLKLVNGKIKVKGNADINFATTQKTPDITYQTSIAIEDLDVDYDGMMLTRINTSTNIKGKNYVFETDTPFLIKIDEFFSGILVKKIRVDAHAQMNLEGLSTIDFSNLRSQVLGGTASSKAFTLTIPFSPEDTKATQRKKPVQPYHTQLNVDIKDLQLGEILALQGNPEIEGKGLLYGELPITINEKNTLISKGWIKNQNPGTLRYRPNANTQAMLKQNNEMKLLLDVLGHLNYHTLQASIDMNDEGLLKINGSLQGINPDFKKGYPLVFNPNIELDLRDMLRSLQITRDVSDNLTKRAHQK